MEEAVKTLDFALGSSNNQLNDIEKDLSSSLTEISPLLDICRRLRQLKTRTNNLSEKLKLVESSKEDLNDAINKYMIPASEMVSQRCTNNGIPYPQFSFFQNSKTTVNNTETSKIKPSTPRKSIQPKAPTPIKPDEIEQNRNNEVTEEEHASIDVFTYGKVSLQELNDLLCAIKKFYKENPGVTITRRMLQDLGIKLNQLPSKLRILKTLHKIELNKNGDVKCCL